LAANGTALIPLYFLANTLYSVTTATTIRRKNKINAKIEKTPESPPSLPVKGHSFSKNTLIFLKTGISIDSYIPVMPPRLQSYEMNIGYGSKDTTPPSRRAPLMMTSTIYTS
jgi:hypothetical protein